MKRKGSFIVAASLIIALLLVVTAGCSDPAGNGNGGDGNNSRGTLTIVWPGKPEAPSLSPRQSLQFSIEVSDVAPPEVLWQITSSGHSPGTRIDNTGLLEIGANETKTTLTIQATSVEDYNIYDTVAVTIIQMDAQSFAIQYASFPDGNSITGPSIAEEGSTVELTIVTDGNSILRTLTITKTTGGTVAVSGSGGNTRTFTMPSVPVDIAAIFEAIIPDGYFSENFDTSKCIFWDKFDGNSLNTSKWAYQNGNGSAYGGAGWGNNEAQAYRTENVVVENGMLRLVAKKEIYAGRYYSSGKLVTANALPVDDPGTPKGIKFAQTYGRFEARIRLTKAETGMWPAFWMMPVSSELYGDWPRSGEIDIMEMKGRLPRRSSSTLHWRPSWSNITDWQNQYRGGNVDFPDTSSITDWHVYGLRWERDAMIFLFDGMEHVRITRSQWHTPFYDGKGWAETAPFDKDFHLILNLAVGGNFDAQAGVPRLPEDASLPIAMEVDWVRCYTLANDPWTIQPFGNGYTQRYFQN